MKKEMIGGKYGKLTVISESGKRSNGETQYLCRCDCGTEKVVAGSNLRNGHTTSCGCMRGVPGGKPSAKVTDAFAPAKKNMAKPKKQMPATAPVTRVEGVAASAKTVPVGDIVIKRNIRRGDIKPESDPKLADLAESIRQIGILEPLIVNWTADTGEYSLVAGHRRLAAAKIAGLSEIPAIIYNGLDDRQVLEMQISENLHRLDISVIEQAETYTRMHKELGLEVKDIAQRIGKSQAHVYQYMNILTLPEKLIGMIDNGDVGVAKALVLCSMPKKIVDSVIDDDYILNSSSNGFLKGIKDRYFVDDTYLDRRDFDTTKEYTDADGIVWPACVSCPHKKQVELFSDIIGKDECPIDECFTKKDNIAYSAKVEERRKLEAKSEVKDNDGEEYDDEEKSNNGYVQRSPEEFEKQQEAWKRKSAEERIQRAIDSKKEADYYLERIAKKGFNPLNILLLHNEYSDILDIDKDNINDITLNELYVKYIGRDAEQIKAGATYEDVAKAIFIYYIYESTGYTYQLESIIEWIGCEPYPDEPDGDEEAAPADGKD